MVHRLVEVAILVGALAADARSRRPEVFRAEIEVLGSAHDLVDAGVEQIRQPRAPPRDGKNGAVVRPLVEARVDVGEFGAEPLAAFRRLRIIFINSKLTFSS